MANGEKGKGRSKNQKLKLLYLLDYLLEHTDETHTGFNLIFINTIERYAKMQDSTCSHSKDCVHSPSITNSGIIYCAPHGSKITLLGTNDIPPWTGGA